MDSRKRLLLIIGCALLVVLYIVSSSDLIYKEEEYKVYRISVLLNESTDVAQENFKLGLEQKEREWMAEINMVSLYENTTTDQQLELIQREINNGAQAIILFPVHTTLTSEYLAKKKLPVPIITVKDELGSDVAAAWIHGNDVARSYELGYKIIDSDVNRVYTIEPINERDYITVRRNALEDVLEKAGITVLNLSYDTTEELQEMLTHLVQNKQGTGIVAMDSSTLNMMMDTYKKQNNRLVKIYGMDYTTNLLEDLEKGWIEALAVHNDYDLGYLSLQAAIRAIQRQKVNYDQEVTGGVITKATMYETYYEKLLFPIY